MFHTYFTTEQMLSMVPGLALILLSIFIFRIRQRTRDALILLLFGALALRISMALLDPFLHLWDEQVHALVAKHMMSDPFNPRLYAHPVLPVDITKWTHNEIWLHKQPLFLWQIALSFKLFGVSEFTLRLPSIIMSSVMVLFIYRMGKLSVNERVGYYAALLWSVNFFSLTLVSGIATCDHNDVAFVFYVTASLWAWTEYNHSGKRYWILLIGLFAGMGVLVKWLTAFLVFSGWGLGVLFNKEKRKKLASWVDMAISAAIAVAILLPWQLYIFSKYPEIARHTYEYNTSHFLHSLEGHGGDAWFYWHNLKDLYGELEIVPFLIVLCVVVLWLKIRNTQYRIAFFTWLLFLYAFFTLAATKMGAFMFPVSSIVLIAIAAGIDSLLSWISVRLTRGVMIPISIVSLFAICLLTFNVEGHQRLHTSWKDWVSYRKLRMLDTGMFKRLDKELPPGEGKWVIFGCRAMDHILVMFYTEHIAYDMVPDLATINDLKAKGYRIAVYDYFWVTDTILNHPGIVRLKSEEIK